MSKSKGNYLRQFLTTVGCVAGLYYWANMDDIDNKIAKALDSKIVHSRSADNGYSSMARKLSENTKTVQKEYEEAVNSPHVNSLPEVQFLPGYFSHEDYWRFGNKPIVKAVDLNSDGLAEVTVQEHPARPAWVFKWDGSAYRPASIGQVTNIGSKKTNGFNDLYIVARNQKGTEIVTTYEWNGVEYRNTKRIINPAHTKNVVPEVVQAMASRTPHERMKEIAENYGKDVILNSMVLSAVGAESDFPMPTDIQYEQYLRAVNQKTGKDFFSAYKDRNPRDLANALYTGTVNPMFLSNPKVAALVLLGQGIERASGNTPWKRHLDTLDAANLAGVRDFRSYHGRDPTGDELERMMKYNVKDENTNLWKEDNSRTISSWSNSYSGQSGETFTYGKPTMEERVRERKAEVERRQQENVRKFGQDAENAAAAIQRMIDDQFQRNQERKN